MATTNERLREVDYPTSDGKPMAETQLHAQVMIDLIETLQDRFANDPKSMSGAICCSITRRAIPASTSLPTCSWSAASPSSLLGSSPGLEEGKAPDLVVEITSKTTRREIEQEAEPLSRRAEGPRAFQFDPTEDYLKPPLQGHRLVAGSTSRSRRSTAGSPAPCSACTWSATAWTTAPQSRHRPPAAQAARSEGSRPSRGARGRDAESIRPTPRMRAAPPETRGGTAAGRPGDA